MKSTIKALLSCPLSLLEEVSKSYFFSWKLKQRPLAGQGNGTFHDGFEHRWLEYYREDLKILVSKGTVYDDYGRDRTNNMCEGMADVVSNWARGRKKPSAEQVYGGHTDQFDIDILWMLLESRTDKPHLQQVWWYLYRQEYQQA